tara:strand:- start:293 stop:484 length:192 start_codon:yes stop_codon:yes gene_type:complete
MKLTNIEFELKWPNTVDLGNLRKLVLDNIAKRGEVLKWSINNIKIENDTINEKILIISAVIIN